MWSPDTAEVVAFLTQAFLLGTVTLLAMLFIGVISYWVTRVLTQRYYRTRPVVYKITIDYGDESGDWYELRRVTSPPEPEDTEDAR